jgi:hypothetical protein
MINDLRIIKSTSTLKTDEASYYLLPGKILRYENKKVAQK